MGHMGTRMDEVEAGQMNTLPLLTPAGQSSLGDCLARSFPGLARTSSAIVVQNPLTEFSDEAFLTPSTLGMLLSQEERLPGMRDELTRAHPVARSLIEKLSDNHDDLPEPDRAMAEHLADLGEVEMAGKICFLDGVPVPLGEAQMSFFTVLRWRPLFHPLARVGRLYQTDPVYDSLFTTDALQEPILGVTTRKYRDQLVGLQHHSPDLFITVWFRRFEQAEKILRAQSSLATLVNDVFDAPMDGRKSEQLLIAFAIMSEWERLFEIADAMKFGVRNEDRVTRESVQKALSEAGCWNDILALPGKVGNYLRGCPLHMRANHQSMNIERSELADSCMLERVREAVGNSLVFQGKYRRVDLIDGELPVQFFAGVELAKFIPVMLEQMHGNLMLHRADGGNVPIVRRVTAQRRHRQMLLSIVVISNFCEKTARQMAKPLSAAQGEEKAADSQQNRSRAAELSSSEWRKIYPFALLIAPESIDSGATAQMLQELVGSHTRQTIVAISGRVNCAFKNKLSDLAAMARECTPRIGEYGWTIGARFDAWLQPGAELEFLRKCTKNIRYGKKLDARSRRWESVLARSASRAPKTFPMKRPTGLPFSHPLGHIHQNLKQIFEPLQFTDVIGSAEMSRRWMMRDEAIRAAALRLPSLSPMTGDPWLSERIFSRPRQSSLASNARKRGKVDQSQLAIYRHLFWQRS